MLIIGTIKCPMCGEEVDSLSFWKRINNRYFHVCKICIKKIKTVNDFLNIGFSTGYLKCKEKLREMIDDIQVNDGK